VYNCDGSVPHAFRDLLDESAADSEIKAILKDTFDPERSLPHILQIFISALGEDISEEARGGFVAGVFQVAAGT
jgi:hypothetical protein